MPADLFLDEAVPVCSVFLCAEELPCGAEADAAADGFCPVRAAVFSAESAGACAGFSAAAGVFAALFTSEAFASGAAPVLLPSAAAAADPAFSAAGAGAFSRFGCGAGALCAGAEVFCGGVEVFCAGAEMFCAGVFCAAPEPACPAAAFCCAGAGAVCGFTDCSRTAAAAAAATASDACSWADAEDFAAALLADGSDGFTAGFAAGFLAFVPGRCPALTIPVREFCGRKIIIGFFFFGLLCPSEAPLTFSLDLFSGSFVIFCFPFIRLHLLNGAPPGQAPHR